MVDWHPSSIFPDNLLPSRRTAVQTDKCIRLTFPIIPYSAIVFIIYRILQKMSDSIGETMHDVRERINRVVGDFQQ